MDEDNISVGRAVEAMKEGAESFKASRKKKGDIPLLGGTEVGSPAKDIFSTIKADISSEPSGMTVEDVYESLDLLQTDDPQQDLKRAPIVIRDQPQFRQYLKFKRKMTEIDKKRVEYLEGYVGRIFYYYKNNYDLVNNITSDIVVQSNFVPFSPMRRYEIPSGVPVCVPRWIILFLKEQCVNNIITFEDRPKEVIEQEIRDARNSLDPIVSCQVLTIKKGASLIKIVDLPCVPTHVVG